MQGAIKVLSVKASSPAPLFTVEVHNEPLTDLDNSSRSDAQSLLACVTRIFTRETGSVAKDNAKVHEYRLPSV